MKSDTKHESLEKDDELEADPSPTLMTTPDRLKGPSANPFRPAACPTPIGLSTAPVRSVVNAQTWSAGRASEARRKFVPTLLTILR
jgi:hypothetical protein